jgi:neutral ceramidase
VPIPTQEGAIGLPPGQEAELRASAVVLEAEQRLCFVSCDTLIIPADVLEAASQQITAETGIPFANLLICATHTHHAPCTIDILGCRRDAEFCRRLQAAIVQAVRQASRTLDQAGPEETQVEFLFAESQEATVGTNSRYLLKDGTIAWYAYPWHQVVRPTGPYDPDLPMFALRRSRGDLVSLLFNHSVHNIGTLTKGALSPAFYGLAAQELERRHGGVMLFLPGAFGSTHNTGAFGSTENVHAVSPAECVHRVVAAVEQGLEWAEPVSIAPLKVLKRPFVYHTREFDEAQEEAAVRYWSETYTPANPEANEQVFRAMRAEMAPLQAQERQTWLQVIRLGDIALVGIPGEMFARLGLEIRRRSPFRYTYVIGLANDTIGYIGDREAYNLGGYQLWAGLHSPSAPGTGEAMVEQALEMLREVHGAPIGPRS